MTLSDHADQRKQTWYNEIILQTEYQRSQVQVEANPAKRVMTPCPTAAASTNSATLSF